MSPSYHSKGASIERSTFNSRGDFSELFMYTYAHDVVFHANCPWPCCICLCDSNDKSNLLLKFLMCENIVTYYTIVYYYNITQ